MNSWMRAIAAGTVLLTGACGLFGEDEEPLEGQRIPVREYRRAVTAPPAPPVPEMPEAEVQGVQ